MITAVAVVVCCCCITAALSQSGFSQYVDPRIGTGGEGFGIGSVPPGAQRPFGAARVSPDTVAFDNIFLPFNHFGGYYYEDSHIRVFSHTHMVGSGVTDYGNVGLMAISKAPTTSTIVKYGFRSSFDHSSEVIHPGYYSVVLEDPKVKIEVTATMHVGLHRYTWLSGGEKYVLLYASHALQPDACIGSWVSYNAQSGILTGWMLNNGGLSSRFGGVKTYFVVQFDQPILSYGAWSDGVLHPNTPVMNGTDIGIYFAFGPSKSNNNTVTFRVAISFISIAQATTNLQSELPPHPNFDAVLAETQAEWETALSMVEVHNPAAENQDDLVKFYSSLYHTLMAPTTFSEVGGVYLGFDDKVHTIDAGHSNYYTDMSIWDVHRSQFPLLALLVPDVMADIVQSLVYMFEQGGDMPRWPLANGYTGCMIGTHADIVIADAYFKGIRNFDIKTAYAGVRQAATTAQAHASRNDLPDWFHLGYIPQEKDSHSVCNSLSYAFDDWAVGNFAGALGLTADQLMFLNRSQNYKNVWNAKEQFFCPRNSDGSWVCPISNINVFDPHYVEGDAWQWRWFVPHDPAGLISLFTSQQEFVSQLDEFFARSEDDPYNIIPNPYYWAGNEPDIFAGYLFDFAGRPDLTQKYVRWVLQNKYTTGSDGLPGNDDYGTMSAWFVFSGLGFYPQSGAPDGRYMLGSPLFSNVTIHLPNSGSLQVIAHGNSATNVYVSKTILNTQTLTQPFIFHNQIQNNATNVLQFWMSSKPNTN